METKIKSKEERAKQRVSELKGFYVHFIVYLAVNITIFLIKLVAGLNRGNSFFDIIFDFSNFSTWFFWGIGLFFHAKKVFGINFLFNKNWEDRQIEKYMKEDKDDFVKFNQRTNGKY
ncbi:2TM domain-containing protein [Cellulophaga baltica]|uniref:2TM domain-containing protein n=1 Tax=Cellulophaga TaxID=104264 RepID=UPI001C0694CD|nr:MULTISPECIES: 2TM domain-containing protein [Cellulophaga]MBU2997350.1 2TM domain-containing protein [Cellulophaga baltica]MDO6768748.1 2TM domain-containing protein [Cellulophaga sp. 1_MG-2023]